MSTVMRQTDRAGAPRRGESKACGSEHRRWPRDSRHRGLVIHPMVEGLVGEAAPVRTHDFSTMGLGLTFGKPMRPGEQFLVPLASKSGPPIPLLYTVVYCRAVSKSVYRIGAELVSVLDLDEFLRQRAPRQSLVGYLHEAVGEDHDEPDA